MTYPTIEYEGPRHMTVSCPKMLTADEVRSYVGSDWTVPEEWVNVIGGVEKSKPNPFKRESDGKYVWLLMRKDE